MSQENVEIIRRVYDALNQGDWDAVFRDIHPDFELTTQRGLSAGTHQHRQGVEGFLRDYTDAFDSFVAEPEDFLENGDQIVVLVTSRGRPRGGSVDVVTRNGHLWRIRDGKLLSLETFPDPEKALTAAGLRE